MEVTNVDAGSEEQDERTDNILPSSVFGTSYFWLRIVQHNQRKIVHQWAPKKYGDKSQSQRIVQHNQRKIVHQ
jgi:hypothetical protein